MLKKAKQILISCFGFTISILVIFLIILLLSLFGGSIMKLFGFQYHSIGQLFLFFVVVAIFGFPLEIFAKALPKALLSLNSVSLHTARFLFLFLDVLSTIVTMLIVDHLMTGVSTTPLSVLVIALIMTIPDIKDIKKS